MSSLHAGSPIEEVAAEALAAAGITAVQIYSEGLYVSRDLDFVSPAGHHELDAALRELGFSRVSGRHYVHDAVTYTLEFPPWPLAIGGECLSPTQCVMDRLAAFYFWRERQALDQAVLVATRHPVDLVHVERWSQRERHGEHFREFAANLAKARDGN